MLASIAWACVSAANAPAGGATLTRQSYEDFQAWLKTQRGKIVIVDCWATYCAPCKKEFPKLVAISEKADPRELVCASVSFDYDDTATPAENNAPVLEFLKKQNAGKVRNILVTLDPDELHKQLGLTSIPTVLVYDRAGQVKAFDSSVPGKPFDYAQVEAYVAELRKP
ncbi:MAG: TlpA disulfide reductase family protein [Pirellulales bacterium]